MRIEYSIRTNDENYIKGELTGSSGEIMKWLREQLDIIGAKEAIIRTDREIEERERQMKQYHPKSYVIYEHVFSGRLDKPCETCSLPVTHVVHQK